MQKVIMSSSRFVMALYYFAAVIFHYFLIFTNLGNYFHNGLPAEWVALQVLALSIVLGAIKLWLRAGAVERFFIALCAAVPAVFVIWSLISVLQQAR